MAMEGIEEAKCSGCSEYICDCVCPGLTGYSRKRRLLREHRKQMRVMDDIICEIPGAYELYLARLHNSDAQNWDVDPNSFDEASDVEDPEAELKKQSNEKLSFVQAARDVLEHEALRRDFERKSMMLEDTLSKVNEQKLKTQEGDLRTSS